MGGKCISQTGNSVLSHRPFHGFFQFLTWTSLGKSVDTIQRSALKLVKLPSLNVLCQKLMKIHLLKVVNFYKPCMVGDKFVPSTTQTSVKFRDFAELYLRSLKTYHFQIWQFY